MSLSWADRNDASVLLAAGQALLQASLLQTTQHARLERPLIKKTLEAVWVRI